MEALGTTLLLIVSLLPIPATSQREITLEKERDVYSFFKYYEKEKPKKIYVTYSRLERRTIVNLEAGKHSVNYFANSALSKPRKYDYPYYIASYLEDVDEEKRLWEFISENIQHTFDHSFYINCTDDFNEYHKRIMEEINKR